MIIVVGIGDRLLVAVTTIKPLNNMLLFKTTCKHQSGLFADGTSLYLNMTSLIVNVGYYYPTALHTNNAQNKYKYHVVFVLQRAS